MTNKDYPMLDLFERTPDLVCIVNREGWFLKINPAVSKTLGYTEAELLARPVSVLIHPDDRERTAARRRRLLDNEPLLNFQNRYLTKNGETVWLEWTSVYIPEKEIVFAIAKDITKRKQCEIQTEENFKKYKELASHFKHHMEKDRQLFAIELHEELAQLATVVKINMESIAVPDDQPREEKLKQAQQGMANCELLINKIRKLSYSMNPLRTGELGLDTVLRSLCNEFAATTGLQFSYKSSFTESSLSQEIKLDLLRICQEALLNVMRHAQATQVKILVMEKKNKIELSITDNGKGFEYTTVQNFGMKSMHGRAASIDGELTIESKKSKGTRVRVRVETSKNQN